MHICHSGHNVCEVSLIVPGSYNYFQSYQESFCLNLKYHPVHKFYCTVLNPGDFISGNHKTTKTITTLSQRGSLIGSVSFDRETLNIDDHKTSLFSVNCFKGHGSLVVDDIMDLTTLFHNLREEVSCLVCSDLFTDPKHLSCLHSFCLKCLKGWYETCGGGNAIRCPKCQTFSQVPASGDLKDLPTSFYLNGLIDVLAIKECSKTQATCGNCDKKSSEASYCFQCCIFYCEECLIGHNIMRDKKEHRVLAVKEFQDKDYEDVLRRPVYCSRQGHQKEELKLFCKECETAVCQTCVMLDHNGHKLTLIEEEAENQRLEIKTVIETQRHNVDEKMNVVAQLDEDYAKVIRQSETLKGNVQKFADGLIILIKTKTQNIITAVEKQTKKSLENLKAKRSAIQHLINVIESSLEEADKLLNRSTTAEVVQLKRTLQTIFQGADETEPVVHDRSSLQALVFVENQKMLDVVNGEELGFLEEGNRTRPSESLAEGEGMKEGIVARKGQFNLITRNAERKQCYDESRLFTVLYFSVRSSRSSALRYGLPSCISVKTT